MLESGNIVSDFTRADAVANFRLTTGHDSTAAVKLPVLNVCLVLRR